MISVEENVMKGVLREDQNVVVDVVLGEEEVADHTNQEDHLHHEEIEEGHQDDHQFVVQETLINLAEEMVETETDQNHRIDLEVDHGQDHHRGNDIDQDHLNEEIDHYLNRGHFHQDLEDEGIQREVHQEGDHLLVMNLIIDQEAVNVLTLSGQIEEIMQD